MKAENSVNTEASTDTTGSDSLEEGQDDDGLYHCYCISDIDFCGIHIIMLFAGWEVRIVKNCDL